MAKITLLPRRSPTAASHAAAGKPAGFIGDDLALTLALQQNNSRARVELFDRYGGHVQRVLVHVLGMDHELADLLHEVFARAFAHIGRLKDGRCLKAWLTRISVFVARECIRSRTRRRWLLFFAPEQLPEPVGPSLSEETMEVLSCTYQVLARLSADERIMFCLRHVHGMELIDLAETFGVSLATIKRKLARAETRFRTLARHRPALQPWVEEGH